MYKKGSNMQVNYLIMIFVSVDIKFKQSLTLPDGN